MHHFLSLTHQCRPSALRKTGIGCSESRPWRGARCNIPPDPKVASFHALGNTNTTNLSRPNYGCAHPGDCWCPKQVKKQGDSGAMKPLSAYNLVASQVQLRTDAEVLCVELERCTAAAATQFGLPTLARQPPGIARGVDWQLANNAQWHMAQGQAMAPQGGPNRKSPCLPGFELNASSLGHRQPACGPENGAFGGAACAGMCNRRTGPPQFLVGKAAGF